MGNSRWYVVATAAVVMLTGCSGSGLADTDPAGHQACEVFVQSLESDNPQEAIGLQLFEVGKHASEATTVEIRDAVEPGDLDLPGVAPSWTLDRPALTRACESNGVEIPDA